MGTFKDLLVWKKGMELAKLVYQCTSDFPVEERFGLVAQLRRCAVSIPSNIAEGFGRCTDKDLVHFLYMALGSCNELETQMILSYDLSFVDAGRFREIEILINEITKILGSLIYRRKNGLDTNVRTENDKTV